MSRPLQSTTPFALWRAQIVSSEDHWSGGHFCQDERTMPTMVSPSLKRFTQSTTQHK